MYRLPLLLFFVLISSVSFSQRDAIYGVWDVYKVEEVNGDRSEESRNKVIRFLMDGTFQAGRPNCSPDKFGTWYYHEESKTLLMTSEPSNKDDGNYSIIKLKRTKMVLENEKMRIYLDRGLKK